MKEKIKAMTPNNKEKADTPTRRVSRLNAYGKIRRAYESKRGTNLSANDVNELLRDAAIYDAVMEAQPEDPEF